MPEQSLPVATDEAAGVERSRLRFPVVGIGASAGGLAALMRFFEAIPDDPGMAFVVILHLSNRHKSHAAEILQRSSPLPVSQVHEAMPIECNHVYVIPPTQQLAMSDGHLHLSLDRREGPRPEAIDVFFRTLAEAHRERGVGVVLSGTGADGAVGIARIKEQGGLTFAQAPEDAEHNDMPRAAIATGHVDFVLAASEMPGRIVQLAEAARHLRLPADMAPEMKAEPAHGEEEAARDEQALRQVMELLKKRTQHDFSHYKRATVLRRIERRMQVNGTPTLPIYSEYLSANQQETQPLLQDMLISVTNFFRDRAAWDALEHDVLPALLNKPRRGQLLRAWVVGCASGEEAYSLAMVLHDATQRLVQGQPDAGFQIFSTDIDDRALRAARAACYPASVAGDLTAERLRQYLQPEQNQLRVVKLLRDRLLFAHHNVLRDPPFSRLSLICCRNLLIYLDRDAQAQVLETFRYALAPGGVLFLGSSESVEVVDDLFIPVDKRHRLYSVNPVASRHRAGAVHGLPLRPLAGEDPPPLLPEKRMPAFADIHQRALRVLVPASVLLDASGNILHLSEGASRFMVPQSGVPTLGLVNNLQPALRLEMRAALLKVQQTGAAVELRPIRLDAEAQTIIDIAVRPFLDAVSGIGTLLVSLHERPVVDTAPVAEGSDAAAAAVRGHLEADNQLLRSRLQQTLENAEISTEELKASNEELQAINEELRSATEELETSKEELQSVNEELVTVNFELSQKVDETARGADDLNNFIAATDLATVVVDGDMRIKRFTPLGAKLFNLIASDTGRSLLDITHHLRYSELTVDAQQAFRSLVPVEREVVTHDGHTYLARALPYRTAEDRIEGVVLTFVDISALRAAESAARDGEEQLYVAVESTRDFAVVIADLGGLVTHWNTGAVRVFGWQAQEIIGRPLALLFTQEDRDNGVPEQEMRTAAATGRAEDERWHLRKDGSRFFASGVMTPFDSGRVRGFCKIARDMTGSKRAELAREATLAQETQSRRQAQAAVQSKDEFLAVMSHELKHPLNLININAEMLVRLPQVRSVEPALHAAQTIQRTVVAQAKIVDDLLDLSRARTGKMTLQLATLDWSSIVRTIVVALQPDAAGSGLTLQLHGADEPLHSLFDRVRAEQIVWNLVGNALKFTPRGGRIDVTLAAEPHAVRLTVADTGKGIAADFVDHVFEMFSQEASFERRREGGLGVGLALVHELVTAHGGRVAAASPGVDQGATFTVWAPRTAVVAGGAAKATSANALAGLRLLLVDDSADTVSTLGMLLRLSGAVVDTATSGAEALRLVQCSGAAPYHVVVSDLSMPDMSGLDLIAALRALPLQPQPLAIACSGYSRAEDGERALAAGFDAALAKPLVLADLEASIQRLRASRQTG